MKRIYQLLLTLILLGVTQSWTIDPPKKDLRGSRPNIIVFFTDDLGYGDVGCYPESKYKTPNLDQLAANGIRFSNFYVPATVCTPSRAGLLSGKYPKRVGLHEAVLFPFSEGGLSPSEYTIAEMLKESGYTTSCIGKWHLGHLPKYMPNNQGFDYFYGVPYSNDMNNHYYKNIDFQAPPLPVYRNQIKIEEDPDQRYLTRRYTEETIKRIKERGNSPFFIYLAHNMPHTPLHVSEKFDGKSGKGLYGDVILELDWSIGEIVKALKKEGIYDNTLLIFTSDNGPVSAVGGSSGPLRGEKTQTWEGGSRVPGIISWPGVIKPNQLCDEMVSTLDLFPTFANLAGKNLSDDLILDGQDVSEVLLNPRTYRLDDRFLYYYGRTGELEAVRKGNWKLHVSKNIGWDTTQNGRFPVSLYRLDRDLSEAKNLSADYPKKVQELTDAVRSFDNDLEKAVTTGRKKESETTAY